LTDAPLRILHFSTGDTAGGAAQAALRLHSALGEAGHDSRMIVRQKSSCRDDVIEVPAHLGLWRARSRRLARAVGLRREPAQPPAFNLDVTPDIDRDLFYAYEPGAIDVVVLHSITRLLTIREIRRLHEHYRAPLVWALADQAALTGGCHYAYDCTGYTARCGRCPQLGSHEENDRSRVVLDRRRGLTALPIVFVAASPDAEQWVRRSAAFSTHRVERIPASVDDAFFLLADRHGAREALDVPDGAFVVLLGAGNLAHPRKGVVDHGVGALRRLRELAPSANVFVLTLGARGDELDLPYPARHLGALAEPAAVAKVYQAADVFLCPTIADAGPMMIPESLLCGTPVVSFPVGYAVDLVREGETGYLAGRGSPDELAAGIQALLHHPDRNRFHRTCRMAALRHAAPAVADAHVLLYRSLLREGVAA
jgi:glycosyltransferase involved in cell wall biosynthesis